MVHKQLDVGVLPGASRNRIGVSAGDAIARALAANTTLTSLSLQGNGVGPQGCALVSGGLARNTILRSLDLAMNNIADDGVEALAPALERAALESLNLSNNMIGSRGIRGLAGVLRGGNLLLQTLDLSGNEMRPRAAEALADALVFNSLLCTLHLDHNQLGPEGMICLAKGLACPSLTTLTLSSNACCDRGARAIAESIQGVWNLSRLDLSANRIGDPGATSLAGVLASVTSLAHLDLGDNFVSEAGCTAVCQVLSDNESLHGLSLKNNQLRDGSGRALVQALRTNTALTQLDVTWNDLNYANFNAIARLVADHAAAHRTSSVPRLQRELARLRKEEPKLVVRQAELAVQTEARQADLTECARLARERLQLVEHSEAGYDDLQAAARDAAAELREKLDELCLAEAALDAAHKQAPPHPSALCPSNAARCCLRVLRQAFGWTWRVGWRAALTPPSHAPLAA